MMGVMENQFGENADITKDIIGCAIEVHKTLGGPGILEKVYQKALAYELRVKGHKVEIEAPCPIIYKGRDLSDSEHPLRIDILVDDTVVIKCKAGAYNPHLCGAMSHLPAAQKAEDGTCHKLRSAQAY